MTGISFDENGDRIDYSSDMSSDYSDRADCFIKQYEEFYKDKHKYTNLNEALQLNSNEIESTLMVLLLSFLVVLPHDRFKNTGKFNLLVIKYRN